MTEGAEKSPGWGGHAGSTLKPTLAGRILSWSRLEDPEGMTRESGVLALAGGFSEW